MANNSPENAEKKSGRPAGPRTFLVLNFIYLLMVYGPSLWILPSGADRAGLADAAPRLPLPLALTWAEARLFGDFFPAYHLVNLALLYGIMVCLFFFTRHALRGPWWLGSLVAVLTMANPLKSEAVLRITGVDLLWPMLLSVAALLMLASYLDTPRVWKLALVNLFLIAGPAFDPVWRGMGMVLTCYALLGAEDGKVPRWFFLSFLAYSLFPPYGTIALQNLLSAPHEVLGPLLLVFYPIGLLPETVARLDRYCWLAWAEVAVALGGMVLLLRKTRSRGLCFALLGMLLFRLLQPWQTEDLVHMTGGGRFLMPIALGSLALTGLFQGISRHPKWARPVIMMTTVLCVIFFALQWRAIASWRETGDPAPVHREDPG